jgi:hypothetical protein
MYLEKILPLRKAHPVQAAQHTMIYRRTPSRKELDMLDEASSILERAFRARESASLRENPVSTLK